MQRVKEKSYLCRTLKSGTKSIYLVRTHSTIQDSYISRNNKHKMTFRDDTYISLTKNDTLLIVLSCFIPPLSIYLRQGLWSKDFVINVLLTFLFGIPGFIHAVYVIYTSSSLRQHSHHEVQSSRLEEGISADEPPNYDSNGHSVPLLNNDIQGVMDNKMQH